MRCGEAGLDIIKRYEGFRSEPYLCPAGVPTIGYGSTWDADGNPVTMQHPPITEDEAEALLARELKSVERAIAKLITVELTQSQFDALASFTYNLGSGNLQASTLRAKVNRGDFEGAANEFSKWRKAGGVVLAGLVRRREEERKLFLAENSP